MSCSVIAGCAIKKSNFCCYNKLNIHFTSKMYIVYIVLHYNAALFHYDMYINLPKCVQKANVIALKHQCFWIEDCGSGSCRLDFEMCFVKPT